MNRNLIAALLLAAARGASASDWRVSTSLNYESGTYGTGTRSSSLYVPLTVKRYWGDWYASITLPYLRETSNGQVSNVGGRPVKTKRASAPGTSSKSTTQSGIGDVVARAGYTITEQDPQGFDLDAVVKVKTPTASRSKGLGTGEFDLGAGLEFGILVAPGWTALADAYYTKIGDPPGTNLNNQLALDAGVSKDLSDAMTLTGLLEGSNALVSGEPAPLDVRATLDYKVNDQIGAFAGVMAGLSKGSSDYGMSLGGSLKF
jgi:hypothetical protein